MIVIAYEQKDRVVITATPFATVRGAVKAYKRCNTPLKILNCWEQPDGASQAGRCTNA